MLIVHPDNAASGSERDFVRLKEARKALDDAVEQAESGNASGSGSGSARAASEQYGRVHVVRPE